MNAIENQNNVDVYETAENDKISDAVRLEMASVFGKIAKEVSGEKSKNPNDYPKGSFENLAYSMEGTGKSETYETLKNTVTGNVESFVNSNPDLANQARIESEKYLFGTGERKESAPKSPQEKALLSEAGASSILDTTEKGIS